MRHLRTKGIETTAHVRPDSSRLAHWRQHFEDLGAQVDTTPWEAEALRQRLGELQPTLVYALLGTTQKRMRALRKQGVDASYDSIDYSLTEMVYSAAVAGGSNPRFVYLSSMGADGNPSGAYMKARAKAEALLTTGPLPYTVARPSFIIGDRDEARWGEHIGASMIDAALVTIGLFGASTTRDKYRSQSNTALATSLVSIGLDSDYANQIVESDALRGGI